MLSKIKKYLYDEIYINIVQSSKNTKIFVEEIDFNGKSDNYEEVIKSSEKSAIYEFINAHMKKSPLTYISLLDPCLSQGAAPTCSSSEMKNFCDLGEFEHVCVDKTWAYYTPKLSLLELQGRYKKTGLDFIFSPFLILRNFFSDKIKGELSLYVLANEDYMALSIFENSKLRFATLLDMQQDDSDDELVMDVDDEEELILDEIESNSVDLDGIDVDDELEGLDELDDLDDLDSFDDLDDFSDDESEEESFTDAEKPVDEIAQQDSFGEDYQRFSLIQSAINTFYKDPKFDGEFVENIYVADGISLSPEFKRFLEEEMFLNVFIRKIDIPQELSELAKVEKK